jgi:hypothetical protein
VGVHLILPIAALVDERELEERAHIGALAGERDEERYVGRFVLGALPVGVEVYRPLEPADGEGLGGDVLSHTGPFGEGVAGDLEVVRPVHRLGDRRRRRLGRGRRGGGGQGGERRERPPRGGPSWGGGGGAALADTAGAHRRSRSGKSTAPRDDDSARIGQIGTGGAGFRRGYERIRGAGEVDSGGGIWGKEEEMKAMTTRSARFILIRIGFGWVINAKTTGGQCWS